MTPEMKEAVEKFCVAWTEMRKAAMLCYRPEQDSIMATFGPKYAKVGSPSRDYPEKLGSVFAFVDLADGKIYKSASYRAPAKHARGSVLSEKNGLEAVGVYGVNYLR